MGKQISASKEAGSGSEINCVKSPNMPGGKGKIVHADGNCFSTENQPQNRGRKPKIFSALLKEMKASGIEPASPENIRDCFMYLLALPLTEVWAIAGTSPQSNDYPTIMRIAAKELLGKNALQVLREMLDRAHGRSTQTVKWDGAGERQVNLEALSLDELLLMREMMQRAQIEDATILFE